MKDATIARMDEDLKELDRSIHTRRIYLQTVTRLRRHFGRPLQQLELERDDQKKSKFGRRLPSGPSDCSALELAGGVLKRRRRPRERQPIPGVESRCAPRPAEES